MEEREPGFFMSLERRMQKAAAVFGLRPGQLALAILAAAVGVLLLIAHSAVESAPRYTIGVSGTIPAIQTLGQRISVPLNIRNKGPTVPDLIINVGGCTDHWVLDGVREAGSPVSAASGTYYDFGSLPVRDSDDIALQLVPRDAGNHVCQIKAWVGPLSSGVPQGDELETVSSAVAINP